MIADGLVAVSALVLLVIASRDAEGDEAAAEPAANETQHEAEDPGEGALLLINMGHGLFLAVHALNVHRHLGPVTLGVRTVWQAASDDHDGLLHHRLLLHHGLLLHLLLLHHGLLLHLLLLHGLLLHLLLLHKRLLLNGHTRSHILWVSLCGIHI